jgi:hypothetical protein
MFEIGDGGDGRSLIELEMRFLRDIKRHSFGYTLHVDLCARAARASSNGPRHRLDMSVG